MNKSFYKGLTERNLLYASRILSNSIVKGTDYSELPKYKVAQLNINCFRNLNGKILSKMMLFESDTGIICTESLFFYNFDIEKCFHLYYNINENITKKESRLIKWGTILYTTDISSISEVMGDDFMNKEDKENFIKTTEELQEEHRIFTDDDIIQLTEWKFEAERLAAREQGLEEGRIEGLKQGHNEGLNLGIDQGIEQGLQQKTIETVKNMLKENLEEELIIKIAGITKEKFIDIKNSL